MFLLDTNTCLRFLDGGDRAVAGRMRGGRPANVSLSSMVKAELLALARAGRRVEDRLETLRRFFEPLAVLPFDDRCAEEYGQIEAQLSALGETMNPADLVNAATARAHDAVLVTAEMKKFNQVAGLRLTDWRE